MIEVALESRSCLLCLKNDFETLYQKTYRRSNLQGEYVFPYNVSVCRSCGFVCQSPVYRNSDILNWYAHSAGNSVFGVSDFDYSKRIRFISEAFDELHEKRRPVFIEFGANRKMQFHDELEKYFDEIFRVDVNLAVTASHENLEGFANDSVDCLASYFVLEHLIDLDKYFKLFFQKLRHDGRLVIEVPDLSEYSQKIEGLVFFEHVNHFNSRSLESLAKKHGFQMIQSSREKCSRPFGFAAAFRKIKSFGGGFSEVREAQENHYDVHKKLVLSGLSILEANKHICRTIFKKIRNLRCLLWCVNYTLEDFVEVCGEIPKNFTLVDSSIEKSIIYAKKFLVRQPQQIDFNEPIDCLLVFSPHNVKNIVDDLQTKYGAHIPADGIYVIDLHNKMTLP